jgi:hypothetical protein
MSSEEMRIELERFVNTGLQEGWTGWPRHDGRCGDHAGNMDGHALSSAFAGTLIRVRPCSSVQLAIRSN